MQYEKLTEQGKLQHDPYQEKVASALRSLLGRLEQYEKDMEEYHVRFDFFDSAMRLNQWLGALLDRH